MDQAAAKAVAKTLEQGGLWRVPQLGNLSTEKQGFNGI